MDNTLIKNGTGNLVDPPLGTKPIGYKWVYKNKYKVDGSFDKHKAKLVEKGFAQKEGVNYEYTFVPTSKWVTIWTLFALVAQNGNNVSYIASINKDLRKGFEMIGLGYVHYYLGIEVTQHLNFISLPRKKYIGDLLNSFMQKPCEGHSLAAKRVLKYLKGTQDFGLKYTQRSHKQSFLEDSTTKVEYVAAAEATKEIVWLKKLLEDSHEKQVHSAPLMIDNTSAINLAKNSKFHDRTKHINTKYHLIRHHVGFNTIHLRHCSTNEKITDIFTKALGR
eukprot:PITA_04717